MELQDVIRALRAERDQIENAIQSLEALQLSEQKARPTRGRKYMDEKGRKEVSERMKRFWERRRGEKQSQESASQNESDVTPKGAFHFTAA